jgi:phosphotriesterase-related protein
MANIQRSERIGRRSFLRIAASSAAAFAFCSSPGKALEDGKLRVMTATGPIDAGEMGFTLTHEHVIADVRPTREQIANPVAPDTDEVVDVVLPHLERIRDFGCRTLIDATGVGIGRHAAVVRRLSAESGLNMLCTTGAYAAADYQFLPAWARAESIAALAARWIDEADNGIDGTGVRPGLIKLSVNGGPLSEIERKLIRAGAIAHLETGLTIGVHTGLAAAAFEQLASLEKAGVHPSAWIWIHAQSEPDPLQLIEAARRGAWISFDGVAPDTVPAHVDKVKRMRDEDLLGRVLVSQDAGWYSVGEPRGGDFRPFDTVFTSFIPMLREGGFGQGEIDTIFVRNPAEAFSIRVRSSGTFSSKSTRWPGS